jgi:hypothetical protein
MFVGNWKWSRKSWETGKPEKLNRSKDLSELSRTVRGLLPRGRLYMPDRLLVCRSSKQQEIPIRILDDEIIGGPRLLFQRLGKGNTSGLKLKK